MFRQALVALSLAATVSASRLGAGPLAEPSDKGEQILNGRCNTACHDLRAIQVQARDKDGWTQSVKTMIDKGAMVSADEIPILVQHLVANHGPLPDGAGKAVLLNVCTRCHDLKRVLQQGATRQQWEETLTAMLNEGAELSEEEFSVLLSYLAKNFKPQ